jgi:hypothetical protein
MKLRHALLLLFVLGQLCLVPGGLALADQGGEVREQEKACAEYNAELEKVRSCGSDDDCGQVIKGSSCGCTRDLLARKDADLTRLSYLRRAARELLEPARRPPQQCLGLTLVSTCDCPETDGFACVDKLCTWNYTEKPPAQERAPFAMPRP